MSYIFSSNEQKEEKEQTHVRSVSEFWTHCCRIDVFIYNAYMYVRFFSFIMMNSANIYVVHFREYGMENM